MIDFLFNSLWGWWGVTGLVVVGCAVVFYLFPQWRTHMVAIAGAALAAAGLVTKGHRDRAKIEQKRKDDAVKKAQDAYDKIDKRPDTPSDVERKMRDGTF
jgi:hypothetical protein